MPIPKPRDDESRDDYVARCMSAIGDEYDDRNQALAVCYSTWRDSRRDVHEALVKAVRSRDQRRQPFGYGLQTADVYVRNVLEAAGLDTCYRYATTRSVSFHDVLQKAASTLSYSSPEMKVESIEYERRGKAKVKELEGVELPKDTLMVFRHVLTTSRKDRDGDVLHPDGAIIDPKMPVLWQHVHTIPIGKMLKVLEQNEKRVTLLSCIVDLNETARDAAVMVANGIGRWSHGFRALKFEKVKDEETEEEGFDIKEYEVMETSLVSVPSNVDAETEEILLDLVESKQLKSPLLVEASKKIKNRRPITVRVPVDLELTVKAGEDHAIKAERNEPTAGASKETDDASKEGQEGKQAGDTQVKALEGSYEWIAEELSVQLTRVLVNAGVVPSNRDDWHAFVAATFSDHVIVAVFTAMNEYKPTFYRIAWQMEDDQPKLGEDLVEVEVTTVVQDKAAKIFRSKAAKVSLYGPGRAQAASLIKAGKVTESDAWNPPSAEDENTYIEANGMEAFAKWHLGKRDDTDEGLKGAWAYIYTSDFKTVDRRGLTAIRQRAGQQGADDVFEAAGKLLEAIDEGKSTEPDGEKRGRVLSKANEAKIKDAKADVDEALGDEELKRSTRALLRQASRNLDDVLKSLGEEAEAGTIGVEKAMAIVLTEASAEQRIRLEKALEAMKESERRGRLAEQYRSLLGS